MKSLLCFVALLAACSSGSDQSADSARASDSQALTPAVVTDSGPGADTVADSAKAHKPKQKGRR